MQAHGYRSFDDVCKKIIAAGHVDFLTNLGIDTELFYGIKASRQSLLNRPGLAGENVLLQNIDEMILAERVWGKLGKPYYTVYPLASEAFNRIRFDIPASHVSLPEPAIHIRFIEGQEPSIAGTPLRSILAYQHSSGHKISCVADTGISFDISDKLSFPCNGSVPLSTSKGTTIEQEIAATHEASLKFEQSEAFKKYNDTSSPQLPHELHTSEILRYVVGIALLAKDPEIIEPDVLAKDRQKWIDTQDPAIVERAHRRGKKGWIVGAAWGTMPHYRRPHLGLRWTGEGRQVPKIVSVKGAVVHRKKLTQVPQGRESEPEK